MEIAIGVQHSPRELRVETRASAEDIRKLVDEAFEAGRKLIWLTDERGKQTAVPVDKLAYVEVGADRDRTPVGFALGLEE